MSIKSMPIVGSGNRVPGPIRLFKVLEDDPRFAIPLGRVTPNVEITLSAGGRGKASTLESWVLIGGVVEDEFGYDA